MEYIFKGLLTCKRCGCLMTPEIKKGKFIYYSCTNAKGICKRLYVPEKTLLERVHAIFSDFESIPRDVQERLVDELRALNESEKDYHNKQLVRVRAEYDRVQKRVNALLDMRLDQSITHADYDKKLQELKDEQYHLDIEAEEYTKADHEYHIHVGTVFNLARRMKDIFESSEIVEKRAFLNFLLQNPTVSGKNLEFTLRKPFNLIHELALNPNWLRGLDSNQRPTL
ncbi:recombinase zinc beta ribbon domain-containing protein [Candidatus Kaiserbacteria bacterium]|nr:recombinase zinc beta ribbon domain-containing protein [Candidatus Kaiserbacteria bacterium]